MDLTRHAVVREARGGGLDALEGGLAEGGVLKRLGLGGIEAELAADRLELVGIDDATAAMNGRSSPTTMHCEKRRSEVMADSRSAGGTFSPVLVTMISLIRPVMRMLPSG